MSEFKSSYTGIIILGIASSLIATAVWEHRQAFGLEGSETRHLSVEPAPASTEARIPSIISPAPPPEAKSSPAREETGAATSVNTTPKSSDLSNSAHNDGNPLGAFLRASVEDSVRTWSQALASNDPPQIANCYAERVERFFRATNTTKEDVLHNYVAAHDAGKTFETVILSDLVVDPRVAPGTIFRVQFQQHFIYGGKTSDVRTVLHLIQQDGGWKINFERQFSSTERRLDPSRDNL